jgi:CheY-like chemotaxis protein
MLLGRRLSEEHGLATEFRAVASVAEGLGIAHAGGPFDVAIVDLMPPDRHRTDVVREIKASYPETLVAVPSGVRDLSEALRAGPTRSSARRSRTRYGVSSVSNTICGRRVTRATEGCRDDWTWGAAKTLCLHSATSRTPAAADRSRARPRLARPTRRADVATRTQSRRSIGTPCLRKTRSNCSSSSPSLGSKPPTLR